MVEDTKFCKAKWTEQWIYVYVIICNAIGR